MLEQTFGPPLVLPEHVAAAIPRRLADRAVTGGAVYEALVGLAALTADVPLVTRDGRAVSTCRSLGVTYEIVTPAPPGKPPAK